MRRQNRDIVWRKAQQQDDYVWPPSPHREEVGIAQSHKITATPENVSRFFFRIFIRYGAGFGAAYGGIYGLPAYIIGAGFTAPVGAVLGIVLGFFDGLIIGLLSKMLVAKGKTLPIVCIWIRWAAPAVTLCTGALILFAIGWFENGIAKSLSFILSFQLFGIVHLIAIVASWHASWVATKKFMEEYE